MHREKVKTILSSKNGMNLYRGCSHGCIYCDSRSKCYQINHDFEDIMVKENAIELLEVALSKKRKKCMIATGSMTDPYIPIEQQLEHTRKALEVIEKYGFGATLITKSSRVLRDLDLLERINKKAKCVVQMTLTTYDDSITKKIEPNVSSTRERFETLKVLRDHNIKTVIWLTPILPWINDNMENLVGILNYAIEAKVYGIICFGMGLTLREGNREYFYNKLDEHFLGLKEQYQNTYGYRYIIHSKKNSELMRYFHQTCKNHGIETNINKIFLYLETLEEKEEQNKVEQISLFD